MITGDLVAIHCIGSTAQGVPIPRERGEAWIENMHRHRRPGEGRWELVPVASCPCCGDPSWPNGRCTKHQGRNPCAIEGCRRTVAAPIRDGQPLYADDNSICGTHWRAYVPPRSRVRRAYNAHWRRAKRLGWNPRRVWAFERFWDRLIRMARRRAGDGFVDEAAINRLMGWE